MSDFQAIGAVSETLRLLLLDRMDIPEDVTSLPVTVGAPRSDVPNPPPPDAAETARVNLFLYRIAENAFLKNQEIPGAGSGTAYGFPPLSLNLFYLLTAYGTRDEEGRPSETLAHFLLGSAMRVFHDVPIVTEDLVTIRRQPVGTQVLHESLRGEFEKVKLSMEPISLEDLSKVWTALTLPFRVAAAYSVTVVQVESRRRRTFPRRVGQSPAGGPHITVVPFKAPRISEIAVHWQTEAAGTEHPYPYGRIGDTLIIRGTDLASPLMRARIGKVEITMESTDARRLEVAVPDNVLPNGDTVPADRLLQPGVQTVDLTAVLPELPSTGFPSNQAVFMLVPFPQTAVRNLAVTPRRLTVTGVRLFHERLSGETVIGRAVVNSDAYISAAPGQIVMAVPDSVVAFPVSSRVSAPLAGFPLLNSGDEIQMTLGTDGPRTVRFPRRLESAADAAALLQAAMRVAADGGPAFRGARVAAAADDRLVIIPGQLTASVNVDPSPEATALGLTAGSTTPSVYLSGSLLPFPSLTVVEPQLRLTIASVTHDIALGQRPSTIVDAAGLLESAIRAFPESGFSDARVVAFGTQLGLVPGTAGAVEFGPVPAIDESSVSELDLSQNVSVRVRVNGAEALDELTVDMTP